MKTRPMLAAALAAAILTAGCAGGKSPRGRKPSSAAGSDPRAVSEADARDLASRSIAELKTVSFAYDSDHLDSAARLVLKANAGWLASHKDVKIQVAGHCDERGTVAYNLALGQRRARAIRDVYTVLGVGPERVATISYGRERPLCADSTEPCWRRNRRGETLVLEPAALAGTRAAYP